MSIRVRFFLIFAILFSSVAASPFQPLDKKKHPKGAQELIDQLGGTPCFDGSAFTCVSVEVPLNHFDSSDTRTISVTFAVLPAAGTRKGMFVTATGGPGTSGVQSADWYTSGFDPSITDAFDIVFFDQRGIGLSGDLNCPEAAAAYYQRDTRGKTPAQEAALKNSASTFSEDCVNALSNPDLLPYVGTEQAVEDLEYFRQLIGDEKFWLYGESYGTQYAQIYAAKHSDHLAGMILDGTVDLTLDGFQYYKEQAKAFNSTLVATMAFCNDDPSCTKDMKGKAIKAYDKLASRLKEHSISFRFPLPEGGFGKRKFTFANLEFVTASQMYNESDRMIFTRALAAYASNEDIVPLARLLYIDLGLNPQTLDVIPDPSYSDAMFYGVECQDYGYPGDSPDEKAENYVRAGDPVEKSVPRLASLFYSDLPCSYWPGATDNLTRPDYLFAEGVPTLVLDAKADPATPYMNGVRVFNNLADGYLITQEGGPHVIFGRGNECIDPLVTDFLVNDVVPAERETVCDGVIADDYVRLAPDEANKFSSPRKALSSAETEINYLPEYFYWDGFTPTTAGCVNGGIFGFEPNADGSKYLFTLKNCSFTQGFVMKGTGYYDPALDQFFLKVTTTGRWVCSVKYTRTADVVKVSGKCNGKSSNESGKDDDHHEHEAPEHNKPEHDDH